MTFCIADLIVTLSISIKYRKVHVILTEGDLVLTSSDQLLLILKMYIFLFYKTTYLNKKFNCTEPSPLKGVPWNVERHCAKWCVFNIMPCVVNLSVIILSVVALKICSCFNFCLSQSPSKKIIEAFIKVRIKFSQKKINESPHSFKN